MDLYLAENDYRFVEHPLIDPVFLSIAKDAGILVLNGIGVSIGTDIYKKFKDVLRKIVKKQFLAEKTTIKIEGPTNGYAVLEFGTVRPAFYIQKPWKLLMTNNLIIRYVGPERGLIREELAPSFLIDDNVIFKQVSERSKDLGLYQIHTPIWVGDPKMNPYGGHSPQDNVIKFG